MAASMLAVTFDVQNTSTLLNNLVIKNCDIAGISVSKSGKHTIAEATKDVHHMDTTDITQVYDPCSS